MIMADPEPKMVEAGLPLGAGNTGLDPGFQHHKKGVKEGK